MLLLRQPPRPKGWEPIPNMSPFCVKLETYLRLAKIPYEIRFGDPRKAPKGKIPFIEDGDVRMGDSGLIIDYLKAKYGDPLDAHLSEQEKATMLSIRRMIEEHTYFCMLNLRWSGDESWPHVRDFFMPFLPKGLGGLIMRQVRRSALARATHQGVGRHTREEIIALAKRDVDAYATLLGDKPYFMGEKPTSLDATMFGFLVNAIHTPWQCPVKDYARTKTNLVAYLDRMLATYWADEFGAHASKNA